MSLWKDWEGNQDNALLHHCEYKRGTQNYRTIISTEFKCLIVKCLVPYMNEHTLFIVNHEGKMSVF